MVVYVFPKEPVVAKDLIDRFCVGGLVLSISMFAGRASLWFKVPDNARPRVKWGALNFPWFWNRLERTFFLKLGYVSGRLIEALGITHTHIPWEIEACVILTDVLLSVMFHMAFLHMAFRYFARVGRLKSWCVYNAGYSKKVCRATWSKCHQKLRSFNTIHLSPLKANELAWFVLWNVGSFRYDNREFLLSTN